MRLIKNDFRMPHKYHPMTVIKSIYEIMQIKNVRDSIAYQLLGMLEPSLFKEVFSGVISHTKRNSY